MMARRGAFIYLNLFCIEIDLFLFKIKIKYLAMDL